MTDSIKMDVLSDPDGQLNTLRDALSKSRSKFGDWMKQLNNRLDEEETAHLEYIAQQQNKISELQTELQSLKQGQQKHMEDSHSKEKELQTLRNQMESIQKETDRLLLQKENFVKDIKEMTAGNDKQKQLLQVQSELAEVTSKEVEKSASYFRERLGLQFKTVSGKRMQLIFTCIDHKDPSRPYYCFVKMTPERQYEVTECTPAVEQFDELVKALNSNNDFKTFVISLRKAFKASV